MIVADFLDYGDFVFAVDALGHRSKATVIRSITVGAVAFTAVATYGDEIACHLIVPTEPSTFARDFPQAIQAGRLVVQ